MLRPSVHRLLALALFCVLLFTSGCISSTSNDSTLVSVVAISRHGIRNPTSPQATMDSYTQRPQAFPLWPTPPIGDGTLSTKGQNNVALLGAWYRDFYTDQGLLPAQGACPAAGAVYAYADLAQRTLETAHGYLDGMFPSTPTPGCGIPVMQTNQPVDPYIATPYYEPTICKVDTQRDLAAFNEKIGNNTNNLVQAYASQLHALQTVTQCCQPAACATASNPNPTSCSLQQLPSTIDSTTTVAFAKGSLFDVADNLTETFELEYAQGMPDSACELTLGSQCVAWAAASPDTLKDMTKLHVLNMVDLSCHLPSYQQVASTNLISQVAGTMEQTLTGVSNPQMLAPPQSTFTLFVAHDENVSALAGFLGVSWHAEGFEPNDPGPAGALVFELRKLHPSGSPIVRVYYVIASLDQMRNGTTLTLQNPPQRIPLAIPACGGSYDCPFEQFKTYVAHHVKQECLIPTPPGVVPHHRVAF